MTPIIFSAAFAILVTINAGRAFNNYVESGQYTRALLTLGGMVALLSVIVPR